jgi:hypothetical protein
VTSRPRRQCRLPGSGVPHYGHGFRQTLIRTAHRLLHQLLYETIVIGSSNGLKVRYVSSKEFTVVADTGADRYRDHEWLPSLDRSSCKPGDTMRAAARRAPGGPPKAERTTAFHWGSWPAPCRGPDRIYARQRQLRRQIGNARHPE